MKTICMGHYSRVGKDSLANFIGDHLTGKIGFKKIPLAWKLKQICHDLYGWAGVLPPEDYDRTDLEHLRDVELPMIGKTPVQLWVEVGMKMRDVYDHTWLRYVAEVDVPVKAVPDIRFPNEFDLFHEQGAIMVKVVRPGYQPRQTEADMALIDEDRWDYVVGGTGKLSELRAWAEEFANYFLGVGPLPVQRPSEKEWQLSQ
jgi:hypothetical protein